MASREEAVQPIHAHCFAPDAKVSKGSFLEGLSPFITDAEAKKSANMLIKALDDAKKAFSSALASTAVSEEGFATALEDYIGALLVMVNATNKGGSVPPSALPPSSPADEVDTALIDAGAGAPTTGGATSLGPLTGDSPLRYAVKFSWNQVLLTNNNSKDNNNNVEIADAVYELASALIAGAIWCQRRAALFHCESTPLGVPSGPSGQAYKLLRQASGMYEYVSRTVLPLLSRTLTATSTTEATDCIASVLQAAASCALGDAESITVLRAISKGNSSSLISALAKDTSDYYKEGVAALTATTKDTANTKLMTYLQYKQAAFEVYAQIFNGIEQWKGGQAGIGLRCLKEAEAIFFTMKKLAAAFDKAPPSSLGKVHGRFDDELDKVLYDTLRCIDKENSNVYYQKMPEAVPPLPEGKRLAASTAFELPLIPKSVKGTDANAVFKGLPASAAENTGGKKANKSGNSSGGCFRCLFCCCTAKAVAEVVTDEQVKKNEGNGKVKKEEGEQGGGNKTDGGDATAASAPADKK